VLFCHDEKRLLPPVMNVNCRVFVEKTLLFVVVGNFSYLKLQYFLSQFEKSGEIVLLLSKVLNQQCVTHRLEQVWADGKVFNCCTANHSKYAKNFLLCSVKISMYNVCCLLRHVLYFFVCFRTSGISLHQFCQKRSNISKISQNHFEIITQIFLSGSPQILQLWSVCINWEI